ncbi:MAG: murein L,D-transpeptidase catalytic domain family protein [Flavobacteriales bacterium]|nr:murein L,D-transpeptidase catalytic domain family protein [Flavobacteriales bacterium]MCB9198492.1 murein L,D-transpeptidase catalytic domain family protein [Flavobacteriales bacterium]
MKWLTYITLTTLLCSFTWRSTSILIEDPTPTDDKMLVDVSSFAEDSYAMLGSKDLFFKPYHLALKGYFDLLSKNLLRNPDYLTIVDMTKSSNVARMFIIDTQTWQIIHKSLVAHGMNTGEEYAETFSNEEHSHQSSLGFFITGEVYNGKHDKSLKLDGQEYTNNKARERGVVVHAADYVSDDYIKSNGRLGRSHGCPAIPHDGYDSVIDKIKEGSCYFIYYPEKTYLKKSKLINSSAEVLVTCDGNLGS